MPPRLLTLPPPVLSRRALFGDGSNQAGADCGGGRKRPLHGGQTCVSGRSQARASRRRGKRASHGGQRGSPGCSQRPALGRRPSARSGRRAPGEKKYLFSRRHLPAQLAGAGLRPARRPLAREGSAERRRRPSLEPPEGPLGGPPLLLGARRARRPGGVASVPDAPQKIVSSLWLGGCLQRPSLGSLGKGLRTLPSRAHKLLGDVAPAAAGAAGLRPAVAAPDRRISARPCPAFEAPGAARRLSRKRGPRRAPAFRPALRKPGRASSPAAAAVPPRHANYCSFTCPTGARALARPAMGGALACLARGQACSRLAVHVGGTPT